MARLGRMLIDGNGDPADIAAGTAWLEKAAAHDNILARRTLLGLESRSTNSVLKRLAVKIRILSLVGEGAREMWRNPDSEKLR